MTDNVHVVVLAAGKGTRMNSDHPKVLHRLAGRRLLDYVLNSAAALSPQSVTVVIGHAAERVQDAYRTVTGVRFVVQEPQLGTGHALLQAEPVLRDASGTALLLYGDVPLLSAATLRRLVEQHRADRAAATVVTAHVERPYGTAASSGPTDGSRGSSRNGTPRPPSAVSVRSTLASTRSTSSRCSTPSRASPRRMRNASTTCQT